MNTHDLSQDRIAPTSKDRGVGTAASDPVYAHGMDRFERLVSRIAHWSDAEVALVSPAQVRYIARLVRGGLDFDYPSFAAPETVDRDSFVGLAIDGPCAKPSAGETIDCGSDNDGRQYVADEIAEALNYRYSLNGESIQHLCNAIGRMARDMHEPQEIEPRVEAVLARIDATPPGILPPALYPRERHQRKVDDRNALDAAAELVSLMQHDQDSPEVSKAWDRCRVMLSRTGRALTFVEKPMPSESIGRYDAKPNADGTLDVTLTLDTGWVLEIPSCRIVANPPVAGDEDASVLTTSPLSPTPEAQAVVVADIASKPMPTKAEIRAMLVDLDGLAKWCDMRALPMAGKTQVALAAAAMIDRMGVEILLLEQRLVAAERWSNEAPADTLKLLADAASHHRAAIERRDHPTAALIQRLAAKVRELGTRMLDDGK